MTTDKTTNIQRGRPFAPGVSGNPKGRPKGSRNAITQAVLDIVEGEIKASLKDGHGLAELRKERPDVFWRFVAVLVPKEIDLDRRDDHVSFTMILHEPKSLETKDTVIDATSETLPIQPTQAEPARLNGNVNNDIAD